MPPLHRTDRFTSRVVCPNAYGVALWERSQTFAFLVAMREEGEVYVVRDSAMTRIIGMEVIAAVVGRKIPGWMSRIICCGILIDHCVATAFFTAQKGIDLFTSGFSGGSPVIGALVWSKRRTEELDVSLMGSSDKPLNTGNQLIGRRRWPG